MSSNNTDAFMLEGPGGTYSIAVTAVASTPIQLAPSSLAALVDQIFVLNNGANIAFIGVGATSAAALVNAVVPAPGAPTITYVANSKGKGSSTYSMPAGAWVSAVCPATLTTTLYLSVGSGLGQ